MKTIVVEKKDGKAIIIDTKGRFHKIKDSKDLIVGKEVEKGMAWKVNRRFIAMGVTLALLVTLGGSGYAYATPVDYVTLDINPSVELGVNVFGKVVDINSFNDDGANLTENLDLKGDTVDEVLKNLVKEAKDQGYLKEDQNNAVMVTVTTRDVEDSDEIQKLAEKAINTELKDDNLTNTEVMVQNVNKERQQEAKMMGISPGKVLLIQKLKQLNSEIKMEDYASKSVKEIMKKMNEERAQDRVDKKETKEEKKGENKGVEASNKASEDVKPESVPTTSGNKEESKNSNGEQNKEVKQEDKEIKQENKGNSNNSNKGFQSSDKDKENKNDKNKNK